jgi:predicted transcriptional regulator
MSDENDDFRKGMDELAARLNNKEPIPMSKAVRRLARQVIEQRDARKGKVETPEEIAAWAKRLVGSMYGKSIDSGDE